MRRAVDYLVYLVVRLLICVVQAMTLEAGARIARQLAWLFADVIKLRAKVVDENLRFAFPELSEAGRRRLARRMWEHLFLLVLEVAQAPRKLHENDWRRYVRLNGVGPLLREMLGERPVVIVTAHFGNFEFGGFMLGLLGFPTYTVARTLDNPYLDRFVNQFRGVTGQSIIPKDGGSTQAVQVMEAGGTMTLLADQYAGLKACWVDFFGRPASAYKTIALLALEHNAPVAVCGVRRLGKPLQFEMKLVAMIDPQDVSNNVGTIHELTQWYTSRIEEMVREAPEQYWWLHRRWKDPRPQRKSHAKAA